jgi:carbon monoxide dehydrogenase subunit G
MADAAWALLTDPVVVASCMPGAAITKVDENGALHGTLTIALGPTRVTFSGIVAPEFDGTQREGRLHARGTDTQGRTKAKAEATFRVTETSVSEGESAASEIFIDATIETAGALAPFARTGGARLATQLLQDFSANLIGVAQSRTDPDAGAPVETPQSTAAISGVRLLARVIWDAIRDLFRRGGRRRAAPTGQSERSAT